MYDCTFRSKKEDSRRVKDDPDPLYPYVCQGDSSGKVNWEGMVWGIANTVMGLIAPEVLAPIAALSSVMSTIVVSLNI